MQGGMNSALHTRQSSI